MKKPIFILRLGIASIIDLDINAIGHLQDELKDIARCFLPFGMLAIVNTDLSPREIKELYVEQAEILDDHAPVIVWDPASTSAAFSLIDFPIVQDMMNEWEAYHDVDIIPVKNDMCNMTLDELIDKVGRTGRESLTPLEFARLEMLSKNP
jgi:hypothetical protein